VLFLFYLCYLKARFFSVNYLYLFLGKSLVEGEKYSVFVRVWYDQNTFAIFRSPGVTIYFTPPELSVILGRNVQEIIEGETKDTDFVALKTLVKADWTGKFKNNGNCISRYHLYISTTPEGKCFIM
jgi:hypothetical protein